MRTIHSDLITAQQSGAANPYIYININSTDYSSRLLSLEHIEEPYRDRAVIVLANSDRHFNSNDLRGKSFSIGYGYNTTSGNRYTGDGSGSEAMPTLWVKSQSMVSMEGELVCLLECEGGWMKLNEFNFITGGEPPYFNTAFTATDTVFQLIDKALVEAGFTLNALGGEDDGIVNSFHPIFVANPLTYDTPASIIYRLIQMTKTYLRQVESLAYEIIYPQSSDAVKETYYSGQAPYFREYTEKSNLIVPNHIVVYCNRDPLGDWDTPEYPLITGEARDADQFTGDTYDGAYTEVIEYHTAPFIGSVSDANDRAEAILQRYKAEALAGRLLLPFNDCRVELYDRVRVEDGRGN